VLVALPGGMGTLDEVFHVIAAATVNYHNKKVVFYNINGFYNKLLNLFDDLKTTHFITGLPSNYYKVADTFDELKSLLI
jgi:predicted Rossmann-fold nucleotide-binding protein